MKLKYVSFIVAALMAVAIPIQAATTFTATGTWTEVFGPGGEGSAGGTLSATMTSGNWTVTLPQAIHQGVSVATPPIFVTNYVVNPAMPAKIVNSDGCTALSFKILTLKVTADQSTASFTMTGTAVSTVGGVQLVLSGSGTVTAKSGSNPGDIQSGPISAQITLTFGWPIGHTDPVTKITETTAFFKGVVVQDGGLCSDYRFVYWQDGGAMQYTNWMGPVKQGYPLTYAASGLTPGILYHSRVEVRNSVANYDPANIQDFVTTARIAISSTDGGSVVVPGEGTFLKPVGTKLAVEAKADAGWAFVGWTGTAVDAGLVADANAATTVTLKGNMTLKANFKIKIFWVSFHAKDSAASAGAAGVGFIEAPDKGYTDLLKGAGYEVVRYVSTATPDVNMLNTASLVIIGRSVGSGNYQNAAATIWNTQITAPLMNTGGYTLRKNRMGFSTGNTIPDTTGDIKLTATNPAHPIFAGITLTDGTMDANFAGICIYPDGVTVARGISVNTDPVDANGTILATISAASATTGPAGAMIIAEWKAGAVLTHDGGGLKDTLAGPRMVFLTGSREANGKNSEGTGMLDLSADGQKMFLNAVKYMVTQPAVVSLVNPSFEDPNAGKIKGWNGEGVGGTPAVDIPGWSSGSAAADSGVEQGWGATDGTWTGFLMSGDPIVYQLTKYEIKAGDIFLLKVDAKNNWAATKFMMILYYDDMALPVPVATKEVTLTDAIQTFSMWFAADTIPDCVGKKLGIELANSSSGATWMGMDNVRLSVYSK